MSIPQQQTIFEVWHESVTFDSIQINLKGYRFLNPSWGFIAIDAHYNYGSSMQWGAPNAGRPILITLIAVKSIDYRDTISRAQELWAENLDDYIAQAVELIENGEKGK